MRRAADQPAAPASVGHPGCVTGEEQRACTGWRNDDCEGTPHCPPRGPRFFDEAGRAYLARPYRDDDFESLVEMYRSTTDTTMGLPPDTRAGVEAWLEALASNGWNVVALHDDRVVGHIAVVPADSSRPEFVVFVHDAYQRRGIGTELVEQAVARASAEDYEALELLVNSGNQTAISLYHSIGFRADDREEIDLEMSLDLDDPVADEVQLPPADRQ